MTNANSLRFSIAIAVLSGLFFQSTNVYALQSASQQAMAEAAAANATKAYVQAKLLAETRRVIFETRLSDIQATLNHLEAERHAVQDRLSKIKISEASFEEVMRLLQTQRVQLTIDLAGLNAKKETLTAYAKNTGKNQKTSPNADVLKLLEEFVVNQRVAASRIEEQFKAGVASNGQATKAKQMLIQAELRLVEAHQSTAHDSSMKMIGILTETELERVEKKARLAKVEELLAQYIEARPFVNNFVKLNRDLESEALRKQQVQARINALQEEYDALKIQFQFQMENAADKDH